MKRVHGKKQQHAARGGGETKNMCEEHMRVTTFLLINVISFSIRKKNLQ